MPSPEKNVYDVSIVGKGIMSELTEELNQYDISNIMTSPSPPTSPK